MLVVLMHQTLERLRELRLTGMAEALAEQAAQPDVQQLSFEERLGLLVDHEWLTRRNRRLARLLKEAKLRLPACLEDIDYHTPRGLDRAIMHRLGTCQWVEAHQNVLITGPTGVGKTFIACALAQAACRRGYRARYFRMSRFLEEIALAKADGSYPSWARRLAQTHVLVLDDWGLTPLTPRAAREVLDILDDRVQLQATIVASQLPLEHWHQTIEDPTLADAILDRLVHSAHRIVLKGESMRKVHGQKAVAPLEAT